MTKKSPKSKMAAEVALMAKKNGGLRWEGQEADGSAVIWVSGDGRVFGEEYAEGCDSLGDLPGAWLGGLLDDGEGLANAKDIPARIREWLKDEKAAAPDDEDACAGGSAHDEMDKMRIALLDGERVCVGAWQEGADGVLMYEDGRLKSLGAVKKSRKDLLDDAAKIATANLGPFLIGGQKAFRGTSWVLTFNKATPSVESQGGEVERLVSGGREVEAEMSGWGPGGVSWVTASERSGMRLLFNGTPVTMRPSRKAWPVEDLTEAFSTWDRTAAARGRKLTEEEREAAGRLLEEAGAELSKELGVMLGKTARSTGTTKELLALAESAENMGLEMFNGSRLFRAGKNMADALAEGRGPKAAFKAGGEHVSSAAGLREALFSWQGKQKGLPVVRDGVEEDLGARLESLGWENKKPHGSWIWTRKAGVDERGTLEKVFAETAGLSPNEKAPSRNGDLKAAGSKGRKAAPRGVKRG